MPRYSFVVTDLTGPSALDLDNVQSVTITKGRTQIQDPFKVGTATITGRVPADLPNIDIGDEITIFTYDTPSPTRVFYGRVAEFRIVYGNIPQMDTWELYCEDSLADVGRIALPATGSSANNATTFFAAVSATAASGGTIFDLYPTALAGSNVSAITYDNGNLLDLLQDLIFTEQGRLVPDVPGGVGWINRTALGLLPLVCDFTDGTVAASNPTVPFQSVEFYSQADSFFDRVVVEPVGFTAQESGAATGKTFTKRSLDVSEAQADNLADYVLQTLQVNNAVPFKVSVISENQLNDAALDAFVAAGAGGKAQVILRGAVYEVFMEGATLTANPDQTRITYSLVSANAQNFFVLDDATFGVLDTNKLGF